MKKYLLQSLLFTIPIILVMVIMEVMLRNIPNDYRLKKEYLDKNSANIETLILGSSHAFYGLDPQYFATATFNASHVSQSLNYDFEIIKKYNDNFHILRNIIIPISVGSIFFKLDESVEAWRTKNYTIYYGINPSKSKYNHSEVMSNHFRTNLGRLKSYYINNNSNITSTELGWGTAYRFKAEEGLDETGKTAAARHAISDLRPSQLKRLGELKSYNLTILRSIIEWSGDNNINVLFLMRPAHSAYVQHIPAEQINITHQAIYNLCTTYTNCTYINLLEDNSFLPDDFYDADHLSELGAQKLSTIINRVISGKTSD